MFVFGTLGLLFVTLFLLYLYHNKTTIAWLKSNGLPIQKSRLWFPHKTIYHEWLLEQFRHHGKTWITRRGKRLTICTYDPDWVREITTTQFSCFRDILSEDLPPDETTLDLAG